MTAPDPCIVSFDDADIGYDGQPVVVGLDLRIDAGEVIGLLGPNGSGKSTVVRGMLGLTPLLAGRLELFGVDHRRFRERWRIGYVPQRHTVSGGVPSTVSEVVTSGRLSRVRPLRPLRAQDRRAVADAIDAVGLGDLAGRPIARLSGGQQRRALIARALASDPELLILDEPTAGVDADNQHALAGALADLRDRGTTILLITHELGPVAPIITRTLALRAGRVVHDGAVEDAPDEHDDHWHHAHGEAPERGPDLGLGGLGS